MVVIGYIRVSTDKQTYKHQRFEIEEYAKNQGLKIDALRLKNMQKIRA